jgi:hypothetical protein
MAVNDLEREQSIAKLNEVRNTLGDMIVNNNDPQAWPTFTGLPLSAMQKLFEWAVVKDVDSANLLLTVAAIAYAHGKKVAAEATPETKAAAANG